MRADRQCLLLEQVSVYHIFFMALATCSMLEVNRLALIHSLIIFIATLVSEVVMEHMEREIDVLIDFS